MRIAFVCLVLLGCGSPTEVEFEEACAATRECSDPPLFDPAGPRERIFRVTVFRETDGSYGFGPIDEVDVLSEVGVPPGPATGDALLVAVDAAGVAIDGQLVRFPTERSSLIDEGVIPYHVEEPITGPVSALAYLRANDEVRSIELVDTSGGTLAATTPPLAIVAGRSQPLTQQLSTCAHVLLVDEAERGTLRGAVEADTPLAEFRGQLLVTVTAALNQMPALLCHSVSRIAAIREDSLVAGRVLQSQGDIIVINLTPALLGTRTGQLKLRQTLLHEATHSATFLLGDESARAEDFGGVWDPSWRSVARRTIDEVRLYKSLTTEWQRINDAFVELGWALDYPTRIDEFIASFSDEPLTDEQLAHGGMISAYGATRLSDDISETVAWAIMGPIFDDEGVTSDLDVGCRVMRRHMDTGGVPSRFAALYTKLHFAQDLGLISEDAVDQCTNHVNLEGSVEGLTFRREGSSDSVYDSDVAAFIGSTDRERVFQFNVSGTAGFDDASVSAIATMQIRIDTLDTPIEEVSWPRGVYVLGRDGAMDLELDGAPNFTLNEGFALFAESSNHRIAGSLFVTGGTRHTVPIPVPEVFDPPYVINFAIENPAPEEEPE